MALTSLKQRDFCAGALLLQEVKCCARDHLKLAESAVDCQSKMILWTTITMVDHPRHRGIGTYSIMHSVVRLRLNKPYK